VQVGDLLAGRYELEDLVGEGGMSTVYRAHDTVLDRLVAIKVLHEHFSHDPEYIERFRREARAIARLTHPNVVTVIDRGEFEGRQFIVFEHVQGETLKDLIRREGPLPVERALRLVHQVGRALAYAHELEIVHRDVKPQNVLLTPDGTAKVTDFGIARWGGPEESLTETGTVLGTSDYIAPEQASGEPVDERSDQYSLGVVLYELLTGEVPYPGDSAMAVAMRHLRDPVPSVRSARPDVPPRVDAIVSRAMAKRPRDRFPTMEAMTAALEAAFGETRGARRATAAEATEVLEPAPTPTPRPRRERPSGRPRAAVVAVLIVAGLALVAGLLAAQMGRDEGDDVRLRAVADHDPEGDGAEHPEAVPAAVDGDETTYWTTETYQDFAKSGVGIVLDARREVELGEVVVVSDEPGFAAKIQAGASVEGPFEDVSEEQQVEERTTFELDTGGEAYRYYVVWITRLDGRAHVNEVSAR
jgi:hypothetical protein